MARAKKHVARFDTYNKGLEIDAPNTKSGKRIDRSKPCDETDTIFCPKGEVYYTWKFRYGGEYRSRTHPKPSQLTQSDFLSRIYAIGEEIPDFETMEDIESWRDDTVSILEEIRDEQEEKLSNMPDSLQESPTGEILQNRYDAVDEIIQELESLDFDLDEDEDDWKANYAEENELNLEYDEVEIQIAYNEWYDEQVRNKADEINVDYQGE